MTRAATAGMAATPDDEGDAGRAGAGSAGLAHEVRADLADWSARTSCASPADLSAVALTVAVHLPDLGRRERALAGLITLWTIGFDALVDEGGLPAAALDAVVARCKAIVRAAPRAPRVHGATEPVPAMQLALALGEIGRGLAAYGSFPPLADAWRASFARMIDAIVRQRRLGLAEASGVAPSDPGAFMALAADSVGVPHYLTACLILYDDPGLATRLPQLLAGAAACARVIRLANDLRTWGREEREGTTNLVVVEAAAIGRLRPELTPDRRRERALTALERRLARQLADTRALLAAMPTAGGAPEIGMARLVRVVTGVYARRDYRRAVPD